jgi:hypothetical protein
MASMAIWRANDVVTRMSMIRKLLSAQWHGAVIAEWFFLLLYVLMLFANSAGFFGD